MKKLTAIFFLVVLMVATLVIPAQAAELSNAEPALVEVPAVDAPQCTTQKFAGPSGYPCIKENCWNYFGTLLEAGEFNFRILGAVSCEDSYTGRSFKFTWYSSKVLYHKDTADWWCGDDLLYRDSEGYIVIAGNTYNDETTFGTLHDTPFGIGKVYDHCARAEQIDCFDVYCKFEPLP